MSEIKKSKKATKTQEENVEEEDYAIKPEKGVAMIDTSSWPLLLKVILLSYFVG